MRMQRRPVLLLLALAAAAPVAAQTTPEDALSDAWNSACAGAAPGSGLAARCAEIFAGGPGSRDTASAGNFLEEIPGQGRSSTRDGGARENQHEQRHEINAQLAVFASADFGWLERKDSANEAAFDGDTRSLTVGLDWTPNPHLSLGLAFNHAEEVLDFDASEGSAEGDYDGGIGYAAWLPTATLSLGGYYGKLEGSNKLRRAIDYTLLNGTSVHALAGADPDSTREIAGLGLDWTLPRGAWQWQLGAGLDRSETTLEAYTESGGEGLDLSVPTRRIVSRRARLDATVSRTVSQAWGVWQPQFRIGWRHEFENPGRPLRVSFAQDAADTPIVFNTQDPDASWGELAVGSVFVFAHGHSGFVQYRQRFGHDFLQERVLALGWRMELK
jgi:outer membrane autotransporter protein